MKVWKSILIASIVSLGFFLFGYLLFQPAVSEHTRGSFTITFVGDIMLGRQVGKAMQRENDFSLPFREIGAEIGSADFSIGNLECVFADTLIIGTYNHETIRFPAYREAVEGLKFAGFDCCSLANNHSMDFGTAGVRSTIGTLEKHGIVPAGLSSRNPVVIRKNGWKAALFAFWVNQDSMWVVDPETGYVFTDIETVLSTIEQAKKSCDIVLLFLHWGKEYFGTPTESQRSLAHRLFYHGADIVIGHGSHQIQEVEYQGTSLIAYGIGNCVFDQKYEETRKGLIVRVTYKRLSERPQVILLPIRIQNDTFVTTLMETDR